MKIKFWLTFFVLSFSLVALAEASRPAFKISDFGLSSQILALKGSIPACFQPLDSNILLTPAHFDFEPLSSMPAGLLSCPESFYPRSVPVENKNGSNLVESDRDKRAVGHKKVKFNFRHPIHRWGDDIDEAESSPYETSRPPALGGNAIGIPRLDEIGSDTKFFVATVL